MSKEMTREQKQYEYDLRQAKRAVIDCTANLEAARTAGWSTPDDILQKENSLAVAIIDLENMENI